MRRQYTMFLAALALIAGSRAVNATTITPTVAASIIDSSPRDGIADSITVFPEPATALYIVMGGAALLLRRRGNTVRQRR